MLLKTKYYFPRPDTRWVARPRLLAKLDADLPRSLTLVVAPAGAGKSTLVNQWLAQRAGAASWLSLEPEDNAPDRFISYLVASIRSAMPVACATTSELISGPQFPPAMVVADALINDLDALPQPLTIVLDDYHAITDQAVHAAMYHIIGHLPAGADVVIISRADPPWKLARMRSMRQLIELRAADLLFTLDETRAFFAHLLASAANGSQATQGDDLIEVLHRRTEGWAAGLQLVRISLQDQVEPIALAQALTGAHRYVMDYLAEEVLAHQPPALQSFLLTSALPERFCSSLWAALHGNNPSGISSDEALAYLDQHNLFLIALDDERKWFRYHHLFRDVLLHQLRRKYDSSCVERMHLRASEWLEEQELLAEAVRHAVLGGQPVHAARIIERHFHALIEHTLAFAQVIQSLLSQLPMPLLQTRPALLAMQAFLAYSTSDMAAMARFVASADLQLAQPPADMSTEDVQATRNSLDWLRGITLFGAGDLQASRASSARALQHLPTASQFERAMAQTFEAVVRASLGEIHEARQSLEDALAKEANPASECANALLSAACRLEIHTGNLDRALPFATRLAEPHPGKGRYWIVLGHNAQGRILHDRWELDAAAEHHEYVISNRYGIGQRSIHESLAGLAWIKLAQGDSAGAWASAGEAKAFAYEINDAYVRELAASLEVGLALKRGDRSAALRQMGALQQRSNIGALLWRMEPRLRRAQLQIAQATPQSIADAVVDLQTCLSDTEHVHNAYQAVEVRALLALGLDAQGNPEAALAGLRLAVEAAAQQGCIRTFVELGQPMADLLLRLATTLDPRSDTQAIQHIEHVLRALSSQTTAYTIVASNGKLGASPISAPAIESQTLLTFREQEVLRLLAAQLSNEDIAERLVLSVFTVKTHASNIYGKLKVANRRQAAAKAMALGILPQLPPNTPNLVPPE